MKQLTDADEQQYFRNWWADSDIKENLGRYSDALAKAIWDSARVRVKAELDYERERADANYRALLACQDENPRPLSETKIKLLATYCSEALTDEDALTLARLIEKEHGIT